MGAEGEDQDLGQNEEQGSINSRQERILVSVRLRPLNVKEIQSKDFVDWDCTDSNTVVFKNFLGERSMYPNSYTFDRVFGFGSSTNEVYEKAAKRVVLSVLSGFNASVFAYGQTSSGKTFTMAGITQNSVADIYNYMDKHPERQFVLKFSAIEIYNEQVRDLLSFDPTPCRLLDDPMKGTVVDKLTEERVSDKTHLLELIAVCEAQRQTGETSLNETSSRSHQILRLTIESSARQIAGGNSSLLSASVNFVDLAGSERTSQTQTTGTRLKEGSHINRSLLTLGKVIRKLSKGRNGQGHVPYRDSKLTRILHNSLGGNARTAIICTMSPAHSHLEQTRNTLMFASCAKAVTNNAKVNVMMSDKALVKYLRKELARLESELKTMSLVSTKGNVPVVLKEKELQIAKMDQEIKELSHQRDLAQSKVEQLLQSSGSNQGSSCHRSTDSRDKLSWPDGSSFTSDTTDYEHLDAILTSESFQYLDEHGNFDFGYEQTSDPLDNFGQNLLVDESLPPLLSNNIPDPLISDDHYHRWEKINSGGVKNVGSDDDCKEVRCIEVEEWSINRKSELPKPEAIISQKGKEEKEHETLPKPEKISPQQEETKVEQKKQERFKVDENEYAISFEKKLEKDEPHRSDGEHEALVKRINDLQSTIDCLVRSSLAERPSPCPSAPKKVNAEELILNRSRSCKAVLHTSSTSPIFQEVIHSRDQTFGGFEKEVSSGRPLGLSDASPNLNDASDRSSSFPTPIRIHLMNEMEQDSKHSDASEYSSIYSSASGTNEDNKQEYDRQTGHDTEGGLVEEKRSGTDGRSLYAMQTTNLVEEPRGVSKSGQIANANASFATQMRNCVSEEAPQSVVAQTPLSWQEEFESQKIKIIELWHACNTPLVHRTYFFLLFKGDPSDELYMEVELRRLSYIKEKFSQGQKIVMDGQVFTSSSSLQALNQEREMLMKHVNKKVPSKERGSLYQKWGIAVTSKQRRLQLVRLIWTNPKDMQHVKDSANLVAKLVGFVDEGQVPKEMFVGPSFIPKTLSRRSYSWKSGLSHI